MSIKSPPPAGSSQATVTSLGKFLTAYRGLLTRGEAARRAGISEERWSQVEAGDGAGGPVSPHMVAVMCAAVRADVATGLQLAGYDPRTYEYLVTAPPGLMHLIPPLTPRIANYRAIGDVLASAQDPRGPIANLYRDAASANRKLANDVTSAPPDGRSEFWTGFASALRALAEEQLRMAEHVTPGH
jgi:Helix-turn-helix domain